MKIIYKEDGKIDINATIAVELERLNEFDKKLAESYRKPITEMKKAISELENSDTPLITDDFYKLMDKLGEGSKGKIYRKTYKLYNGKQSIEINSYTDLFERQKHRVDFFKKNGIEYYDALEEADKNYRLFSLQDDISVVILNLIDHGALTYDKSDWYVSKIEDQEGNIIYSNDIGLKANSIEIYEKCVKKFGKFAGIGYLQQMINAKEYPLHTGEYLIKKSKEMLGEVTKLIEDSLKCYYPQRKEELIECLLNNAIEPDVGEDEFDVETTFKVAVRALQMIKENSTSVQVCEFVDKAKEERRLINDFDIYCFLAKFGKETGIQVFEEKVIKPAEKRDGEVGYSDCYVCNVDKAKATAEKYRQENKQFEKELTVFNIF